MISVILIVLCLVSKYSCFQGIAAPLVNNQQAPLVAIVDTGKIVEQIMEALDSPVRELIKSSIEETVNNVTNEIHLRLDLIEKQLNETKSQDQSKALPLPTDCTDLLKSGSTSGVHAIYPDLKNGINAYCDMDTDGGGWTVFQKRIDWRITFNRNWTQFENGFGDLYTEYWLGEALKYNSGAPFSTFDQDNESDSRNLAMEYGAWWYNPGSFIWLNHDTKENYWDGTVGKKSVMMMRKIQ